MGQTNKQKVKFNAPAAKLYNMYMTAKLHEASTGYKTKVTKEVGSAFVTGGGHIKGKILLLKPKRMIVQTWRGKDWPKDSLDSILVLTFSDVDDKGQVEMVQTGVPDEHAENTKLGWNEFYWKPWKEYLKSAKK